MGSLKWKEAKKKKKTFFHPQAWLHLVKSNTQGKSEEPLFGMLLLLYKLLFHSAMSCTSPGGNGQQQGQTACELSIDQQRALFLRLSSSSHQY